MSMNRPKGKREPILRPLPGGQPEPARVEVLEAVRHGRYTLAAVRVLAGELHAENTLVVADTGERWRVLGFGFIPADAWADGRRALSLASIGEVKPLGRGDRLLAE